MQRITIHFTPWVRGTASIVGVLTLAACGILAGSGEAVPPAGAEAGGEQPDLDRALEAALDSIASAEAVPLPPVEMRSWAERTLDYMTLAEKAGQLIMPWVLGDFAPEGSPSHERVFTYYSAG